LGYHYAGADDQFLALQDDAVDLLPVLQVQLLACKGLTLLEGWRLLWRFESRLVRRSGQSCHPKHAEALIERVEVFALLLAVGGGRSWLFLRESTQHRLHYGIWFGGKPVAVVFLLLDHATSSSEGFRIVELRQVPLVGLVPLLLAIDFLLLLLAKFILLSLLLF